MASIGKNIEAKPPCELSEDLFYEPVIKTIDEIIKIISTAIEKRVTKPEEITIPGSIYWRLNEFVKISIPCHKVNSIYINEVKLIGEATG